MGPNVKIAITSTPAADEDLTLDEIATFLDRARRLGIPGSAKPKVNAGWTRGVKRLDVSADSDEVATGE